MRFRVHGALSPALLGVASAVFALAAAGPARADGDADDFRQSCASCHTIGGGRLVGPDLKDVSKRQRREWLVNWIADPMGVLNAGDPYAQRLKDEARGAVMTQAPGMTAKRAAALLDLIDAESKLEKSRFASTGLSERAFTPADVAAGREIFLGARRLAGGGPACFNCHSAGNEGGLGGGRLGPDLSDAFARLGGRKALGAWFLNPPTERMKPLFAQRPLVPDTEILQVLAFLKDTSDRHEASNATAKRITYLLLAAAGAAAALILMDLAWKRRFRGVRSALVHGHGTRGADPAPALAAKGQ